MRALPLSAVDGFVLSRVDGHLSSAEIASMTGLPPEQVSEILARLVRLGAAHWKGAVAEPHIGGSHSQPPAKPARTPLPRPHSSAAPGRRRPSWQQPQQRRMFAESSISAPPPDMRALSQRPRSATPEPSPSVPTPPPSLSPPAPRPGSSEPPEQPRDSDQGATYATIPIEVHASVPPLIAGEPVREPVHTSLYDVSELDEEVDLPRERRKQVLDLYYRREQLDYYQRLGVGYDADKKQIRTAYFALSKAFHPDSMFRKQLGSYEAKMSAVFSALTEAYETLSKARSRAEYDGYLRSTRSIADAERALSSAPPPLVEVPRPPPLPSGAYDLPPPTPLPAAPREVSPEAKRIAREVLERRLRGVARVLAAEQSSALGEPRPSLSPDQDRKELAKQLTRTLIGAGKVTGSSDKLTRAVLQAKDAFERGDVALAVKHMSSAVSLAPERGDLRVEHERLTRIVAEQLAHDYAEHARFEAKHGKWASAAASWVKVCEGRPEDSAAHRAAAFALMKAGSDLRGAQRYAQRAVFLTPDDVDARVLLAQVYLTLGLKLNARRELEAAAKLDPDNEIVKNLSSETKG